MIRLLQGYGDSCLSLVIGHSCHSFLHIPRILRFLFLFFRQHVVPCLITAPYIVIFRASFPWFSLQCRFIIRSASCRYFLSLSHRLIVRYVSRDSVPRHPPHSSPPPPPPRSRQRASSSSTSVSVRDAPSIPRPTGTSASSLRSYVRPPTCLICIGSFVFCRTS